MKQNRRESWSRFARSCARDAHENHFASRRGIWQFEDLPVLVVYNNNPSVHDPLLGDRELAASRTRLSGEAIAALASATYPVGGLHDGYRFAVGADAPADKEELVGSLYEESLLEALPGRDARSAAG